MEGGGVNYENTNYLTLIFLITLVFLVLHFVIKKNSLSIPKNIFLILITALFSLITTIFLIFILSFLVELSVYIFRLSKDHTTTYKPFEDYGIAIFTLAFITPSMPFVFAVVFYLIHKLKLVSKYFLNKGRKNAK